MPRSGAFQIQEGERDSNPQSSDDPFVNPDHTQMNGHHRQERRGGEPGWKRKREKNSKQLDPPHRKPSCSKRKKPLPGIGRRRRLQEGQIRKRYQKKNQSQKKNQENYSIQNESESTIFAVSCQQQKNEQPIQQGQKKKQSKKKKNPSTKVESENDIFAESQQKKNERPIQTHQHRRMGQQSVQPNDKGATKGRQNPKKTRVRKNNTQYHYEVPAAVDRENNEYKNILEWDSPIGYVPLLEEESMVEFMFQRNGKRERGMLKNKPSYVVNKYRKAAHQRAPSMTFPQVLSLRRHHIKLINEHKNMTQLGLGTRDEINASARLFECAIEEFLKKSSINFLTEEDQKKEAKTKKQTLRATPDFVLPKPIVIRRTQICVKDEVKSIEKDHILEERTIHWIEAKMFYGASSIPHGSNGAVGCILKKSKTYVNTFGEGAMLFMMGCGDKLAEELNDIGVTVLDCSGNTVSLDRVHDHQRTWCANEKGNILP